jgi:cell division protein FtsI/penicillin-binding protein 2
MAFISVILSCALAVIVVRLFIIQVINSGFYSQQSRKQTQQRVIISARRGNILDRNGVALATNVGFKAGENVDAADDDGTDDLFALDGRNGNEAPVKRLYPFGDCAGAVLGYVGRDGSGLGGAEFYFEKYLKGEAGWTIMSRDARNRKYAKISLPSKEPHSGANVYLTIDVDIQKIVENALRQTVESLKAEGGMCIIIEPSTGKILAMAGDPPFNPNFPSKYQLNQRLNRCINYTYEPGSTFKALAAACAMEKNLVKESDTLDGNMGFYEVYDQKIRDKEPRGRITFIDAFKYSSNVCFAKVANVIGNRNFYSSIKDFGFGSQTGIELPGEESGTVRPIDKWSGRSRVTMAIGQEISATLLQMSMLYSTIANGGILVEPRIVEKIVGVDGSVLDSGRYRPVRRVVSSDVADRLKRMLCEVVNSGTGRRAAIRGVEVAGKTGTAQKFDKVSGSYSGKKAWASFIGFLPSDKPLLLGAIVIDEPANAEMGGAAAAPVFRNIMSQIISHPQLEYAEKILHENNTARVLASARVRRIPEMEGLAMANALMLLKCEKLPYEIIGDPDGKVASQFPEAGAELGIGEKIKLYACTDSNSRKMSGLTSVPECCGKDMRDAINALNMKGLIPYINGSGMVKRQSPGAGVSVKTAAPCTLYCSFDYCALSAQTSR